MIEISNQKLKYKKENILNEMENIIIEEQGYVIKRCKQLGKIPKDIAENTPLKENIFSMFVCIFSRIPLFICGKPGSSKTISMIIVKDSFNGQQIKSGNSEYLDKFPIIYIFPYQGSKQSTEKGIKRIFNKAARKCSKNQVGLVFFDEIGIAELSPNKPLKVLHEYLGKSKLDDNSYGKGNL